MNELEFFDCSCFVGMRGIMNPGSFYSVEGLTDKIRHYGINKALVYHSLAREYNPIVGNYKIADTIKEYPHLYPVWVVMPHHTGEFPDPGTLRTQLKEHNIKAVRMFPGTSDQNYSIEEWSCGELFDMLELYNIPLFIGLNQLIWEELHHICKSHPKMKLVLTDLDYRSDRNLYALLNLCEYLYIETFGYKVHQGIEEICRKFGAGRLVFGSGMPVYSGGSAVCMLNYAKINEKEKRMIAAENLETILGSVDL